MYFIIRVLNVIMSSKLFMYSIIQFVRFNYLISLSIPLISDANIITTKNLKEFIY